MTKWNWQLDTWPHFEYDVRNFDDEEARFLFESGRLLGLITHLSRDDEMELIANLVGEESLKTSEIEGQLLQRESIHSSILRHLGYKNVPGKIHRAENAIATIAMEATEELDQPLTRELLFRWNRLLTSHHRNIDNPGGYRTHEEPIHVVSGDPLHPRVHFTGPPSGRVPQEMDGFIQWFNDSSPQGKKPLRPLTRAAICHLYFLAIHPFEDGNGRIGRNLVIRTLSQQRNTALLISLSEVICNNRKNYYEAIGKTNTTLNINDWISFFSEVILKAMQQSIKVITFTIEKGKFFQKAAPIINDRQKKVLLRMFQEGPEGFTGGLSANNYIKIAKTSRATATRDLLDLVEKNLLKKQGRLKSTRYYLDIEV